MDISELLDTPDGAVLAAIGGEVALVTMRHETVNRVTIERFPMGAVAPVDAVLTLLGAHGFSNRELAIAAAPVETPALPAPVPVVAQKAPEHRPHVCPDCGQRFTRKDHLNRHELRAHSAAAVAPEPAVPVTAPHICPECGQGFTTKKGLGHHRSLRHGVAGVTHAARPGEHICPDCPKTFDKQRALGMHRWRVHGIHRPARRAPITGDHVCADCDARFETPASLAMHQMKAHRIQPDPSVTVKPSDVSEPLPVTLPAAEPPPPMSLDVAPLPTSQVTSEPPVSKDRKIKGTPVADGSCPTCHEPLVSHEECDQCQVLIGPRHATERAVFVTGLNLCGDCARVRSAARKAELAAA